jgi:hypothetical protein
MGAQENHTDDDAPLKQLLLLPYYNYHEYIYYQYQRQHGTEQNLFFQGFWNKYSIRNSIVRPREASLTGTFVCCPNIVGSGKQ